MRTKKPFKSIESCSFPWLLFPAADLWLISGQITPGDPGHWSPAHLVSRTIGRCVGSGPGPGSVHS